MLSTCMPQLSSFCVMQLTCLHQPKSGHQPRRPTAQRPSCLHAVTPQARQNYAIIAEQLDSGKRIDWSAALSLLFKVGRPQRVGIPLTAAIASSSSSSSSSSRWPWQLFLLEAALNAGNIDELMHAQRAHPHTHIHSHSCRKALESFVRFCDGSVASHKNPGGRRPEQRR